MKRLLLSWFSAEALETIGLWLIIAGLIGEAALVFSWLETGFEKPLTFVFTVMIAFGVWVENVGDADISSEKDARIAEANARALEAKLELEKYKEPRALTEEEQQKIATRLKQFAGQQYAMSVSAGQEAENLMCLIDSALKAAGWVRMPPLFGIITGAKCGPAGVNTLSGISIRIAPDKEAELGDKISLFAEELKKIGFDVRLARDPDISPGTNTVHVMIGQKP